MKKIEGMLEIDEKRGVIYFHNNSTGQTFLRICNIKKEIPKNVIHIDITHMVGISIQS